MCWPITFAYLSISLTKEKAIVSKKKSSSCKEGGACHTNSVLTPYIRPLNFTIGSPQLLPCAKWFHLHSPSAAAAPSEMDLGGRRGSARLPSETRACQSVSLHPVGQLYVNVYEGPGTRSSRWDCQADTEQRRPSQSGAKGTNLADYTFRKQMRLHQRGPPITNNNQMCREPYDKTQTKYSSTI